MLFANINFNCICLYISIATTAAVEGKLSKGLRKVLKKAFSSEVQEQLAVADSKLGSAIKVCVCVGWLVWWGKRREGGREGKRGKF